MNELQCVSVHSSVCCSVMQRVAVLVSEQLQDCEQGVRTRMHHTYK